MTELIGFAAAFLTTVAFLPQAIKVQKTKRTEDLSLLLFVMLFFGVLLWLTYGMLIVSAPIVVANVVTLSLVSHILYHKIRS